MQLQLFLFPLLNRSNAQGCWPSHYPLIYTAGEKQVRAGSWHVCMSPLQLVCCRRNTPEQLLEGAFWPATNYLNGHRLLRELLFPNRICPQVQFNFLWGCFPAPTPPLTHTESLSQLQTGIKVPSLQGDLPPSSLPSTFFLIFFPIYLSFFGWFWGWGIYLSC